MPVRLPGADERESARARPTPASMRAASRTRHTPCRRPLAVRSGAPRARHRDDPSSRLVAPPVHRLGRRVRSAATRHRHVRSIAHRRSSEIPRRTSGTRASRSCVVCGCLRQSGEASTSWRRLIRPRRRRAASAAPNRGSTVTTNAAASGSRSSPPARSVLHASLRKTRSATSPRAADQPRRPERCDPSGGSGYLGGVLGVRGVESRATPARESGPPDRGVLRTRAVAGDRCSVTR